MKGLWNLSQDEVMREIMEAEENQRRDQLTREEFAWERGEQAEHKKGREEGIRQVAQNMLAAGAGPKFVAKSTGLTLEEVEALAKE